MSKTIHDKAVPELTLIISEVFMFKNDLHAECKGLFTRHTVHQGHIPVCE